MNPHYPRNPGNPGNPGNRLENDGFATSVRVARGGSPRRVVRGGLVFLVALVSKYRSAPMCGAMASRSAPTSIRSGKPAVGNTAGCRLGTLPVTVVQLSEIVKYTVAVEVFPKRVRLLVKR